MSKISDIIKTKIERLATKSKKDGDRNARLGRHWHKENKRFLNRADREIEEARLHPTREYTKEELNKMDIEARRSASHYQKIRDKRRKNIDFENFDEDIPF